MAVKTDREKLCSLLGLQNLHVGNIVGTGHVERDIVLPILSVCLSNAAVLCQNKRTISDILVGTSFCCFLAHLRHKSVTYKGVGKLCKYRHLSRKRYEVGP